MSIGDFYETYDDCAKWCVGVLGLEHTEQVKPDKTRHVMVTFPKQKMLVYVSRLLKAGCSVVVLDNDLNEITNRNNNSNNQTTNNQTTNNSNNTAMEEKKEEKKFATMKVVNVYWFNTDREALVKLVLVRSSFNIDSAKAKHEWAEADGDKERVVLVTQYDPQEPQMLPAFYATTADFENGKTMSAEMLYWMRDEEQVCVELLKHQYNHRTYKDEKGVYIWAYIKGRAVKWYFRKHIDVVTFHNVNGAMNGKVTADTDVPMSYYSAEEVYQYNDWVEITETGERICHEGVYNRLRLEPDQKALAEKLQAVIDECKAAGMDVYYNLCDYNLHAVNKRHVEQLAYDPEVDEDTERAYVFEDRVGHTFSGIYDLNTEDTEVKFVIKK